MRTSPIPVVLAIILFCIAMLAACADSTALQDLPSTAPAGDTSQVTDTPALQTSQQIRTPTVRAATRATAPVDSSNGFPTINVDQLPPEARDTLALIDQGGPFPYRQDGVVFQNREGNLPDEPNGYYHEYTVVTPGSSDRGARRIIEGRGGELYYTDDHYVTFRRIVQ